ncbi:MAG: abortive infection family protein [Myxococcota bacterium]
MAETWGGFDTPEERFGSLSAFEKVEALQDMLISRATGAGMDNADFVYLRRFVLNDPVLSAKAPGFLRRIRDEAQFWGFIQPKFGTYRERREYIWEQFRSLLETAEAGAPPVDEGATDVLRNFSPEGVHATWAKALERRESDPEGAITLARTLLEDVCKHILDDLEVDYDEKIELPKLYKTTARRLNLSPGQHSEEVFKQILSGCVSVVGGLGSMRNRLSDSHGKGRADPEARLPVRPSKRHAKLAVNLAGAMATFLVETLEERRR